MKKILSCILGFLTALTFTACNMQYKEEADNSSGRPTVSAPSESTGGGEEDDKTPEEEQIEFTVTLKYEKETYTDTEGMTAQWTDGYQFYQADFVEGVASIKGLDGDYSVTISGLDDKYAYNPGVHKATNITPNIEIPVYKIVKARGKSGDDEYNCKTTRGEGVYRVEIDKQDDKVFFEFEPTENGVYTIESWVDVLPNEVNPKIYVYNGSNAYKTYAYTLDEGGVSKGYTRNFKHTIEVDASNIGGVWTFAIGADHKDGVYPVTVDFALARGGSFERVDSSAEWILAEDLYQMLGTELKRLRDFETDENSTAQEKYLEATVGYMETIAGYFGNLDLPNEMFLNEYNALKALTDEDLTGAENIHISIEQKLRYCDPLYEHGELVYDDEGNLVYDEDCRLRDYLLYYFKEKFAAGMIGTEQVPETWYTPEGGTTAVLVFRGENYQFNETTGFYHKYDEEAYANDPYKYGAGYGPVLYAKISGATRFIDLPFTAIEYQGNKALTVENGTQNYKLFVEGYAHIFSQANTSIGGGQLQGMPVGFPEDCTNMFGYNDFCTNGLAPVTPEVKEFLQKYSVNQRLFFDGNGFAEKESDSHPRIDALEEDQWLFGCCYFE